MLSGSPTVAPPAPPTEPTTRVIPEKDPVHRWTQPGGCSTCKSCGCEPDGDPFCVNPEVAARKDFPWGQGIDGARPKCKGAFFEQHPGRVGWSIP